VFPEEEFRRFFDPLADGPKLVERVGADGLLLDNYAKLIGKGLFDYYSPREVAEWVSSLHAAGKEAWIAGSLSKDDLPAAWATGVDVVCVRAAACAPRIGAERFGDVSSELVAQLVVTIPQKG
jgi:uncharacterized protein (UPF0264 family)